MKQFQFLSLLSSEHAWAETVFEGVFGIVIQVLFCRDTVLRLGRLEITKK